MPMGCLSRRRILGGLGIGGLGLLGLRACLPRWLASGAPRLRSELSQRARLMIEEAYAGLDAARVWDLHVHLVGIDPKLGTWVNPNMQSHLHPLERLRYEIYMAAGGVEDSEQADEQYLQRLLALGRDANPEGKLLCMAFDYHVSEAGEEVPGLSAFYTSNERVLGLAKAHPELAPCASVHPYRRDALERLEQVAEQGALGIKWLPNAMGIDPASPRCQAYYERLAELQLVLITHTGVEKAVHAEEHQKYGNPLRLRRALDAGVRVVAAHCASLGSSVDLDDPARPERPAFELFLRLMEEYSEAGNLYGELSALTLSNRDPGVLRELLTRRELHSRLVNGSDYPLPAINPMISPRLLSWQELLDSSDGAALAEIYSANPLLFDFVLKRRLRHITGAETHRFEPALFESARLFEFA